MQTIIKMILIGASAAFCAKLNWSNETASQFSKVKRTAVTIYSVKAPSYDQNLVDDLTKILGYKKSIVPLQADEYWSFEDGALHFSFSLSSQEYFINDESIGGFDQFGEKDQTRLKEKADQIVNDLLGRDFVFVNSETEKVTQAGSPEKIKSYGLRYIRKLNGRYILGAESYIRIVFGKDDSVKMIALKNPILKEKRIERKLVALDKIMNDYKNGVSKKDSLVAVGKVIRILEVKPKQFVLAYYPEVSNNERLLVPGLLVTNDLTLEGGRIVDEGNILPEEVSSLTSNGYSEKDIESVK